MAAFGTNLQIDGLRNYRGPGLFLGAGVLAGLIVFLVWFASLPSADEQALAVPPPAAVGGLNDPLTLGANSAGGVTGAPTAGQASATLAPEIDSESISGEVATDEFGAPLVTEPAEDPNPQGLISDEQAIANGLLDAAPAVGVQPPPAPVLQTYYVEVMPEPGVIESLEVNAESAEHARSIIREFRKNPRIIRGPSTQPLD